MCFGSAGFAGCLGLEIVCPFRLVPLKAAAGHEGGRASLMLFTGDEVWALPGRSSAARVPDVRAWVYFPPSAEGVHSSAVRTKPSQAADKLRGR